MHPFVTYASLRLALVPKGCNFIAPVALMQQFIIIALFCNLQKSTIWCHSVYFSKSQVKLQSCFLQIPVFISNWFDLFLFWKKQWRQIFTITYIIYLATSPTYSQNSVSEDESYFLNKQKKIVFMIQHFLYNYCGS